jgi:4-hydroxyphenylpyruvate dioxygenase
MNANNPLGMRGLAFVQFASDKPETLRALFRDLGFSCKERHATLDMESWRQHGIELLLDADARTFGHAFQKAHGPSVSALGIAVDDAQAAIAEAVRRGARPYLPSEERTLDLPAIYGIGDSLVYFVERARHRREFVPTDRPDLVADKGFLAIDHLTNNVHAGTLGTWSDFYKRVFGFTEVRSFDIEGNKSGLYSFALRSPCGTFCIPINEDKGDKGQIAEYLREYRGPGVQHIAFLTKDILASLDAMSGRVPTLDIDDTYYADVFGRVPNVVEDRGRIRGHNVLVDGDDAGYLLQIFTKNVIGPIFFEIIQRENHLSFGEGNFGALFRSIERDQEKRGVL